LEILQTFAPFSRILLDFHKNLQIFNQFGYFSAQVFTEISRNAEELFKIPDFFLNFPKFREIMVKKNMLFLKILIK